MKLNMQTVLASVLTGTILMVGNYLFNSPTLAQGQIQQVKQDLSTETLNRSNSDTKLEGEFQTVNEKLDAIISGLNIKYSLPITQKKL